jgi:Velvet factor
VRARADFISSNLTPNDSKYSLSVRQQPIAARACGFGERDRRVIDPPPILQFHVEDPTETGEQITSRLRQAYLIARCTLWDPIADVDASAMPGSIDKRQQRRVMGTLVSSPFVGKDEFNIEGCFFSFPDLSVRTPGKYFLRFTLVALDFTAMHPGHRAPVKAVVYSDPFDVFNAKDFGGMHASTELTKRLKHQGDVSQEGECKEQQREWQI